MLEGLSILTYKYKDLMMGITQQHRHRKSLQDIQYKTIVKYIIYS